MTEQEKVIEEAQRIVKKFGDVYAPEIAVEIRNAITMYTGNLNPKWKFYDEVQKYLRKHHSYNLIK